MGLRDTGRHRPDTDLRYQLHRDTGIRIGIFKVKNQLGQILDRIDVVVGRRRDQLHTRCGIAKARDVLVHLMTGQLTTFSRFRPLRHLDLQFPRIHKIMRRDSESGRRHLLNVTILGIAVRQRAEPLWVFPPFARIALAAKPIHRDCKSFMRFFADRAERHGTGVEALHNFLRRFHFFNRNGLRIELEVQQTTQVRAPLALIIHDLRKLRVRLRVV